MSEPLSIRIEMNGMPSQFHFRTVLSIERRRGIVTVSNPSGARPSRYRLADGLHCNHNGQPSAWQFWWLPPTTRAILRQHIEADHV